MHDPDSFGYQQLPPFLNQMAKFLMNFNVVEAILWGAESCL
jgi:hypothetical protein